MSDFIFHATGVSRVTFPSQKKNWALYQDDMNEIIYFMNEKKVSQHEKLNLWRFFLVK